MTSIEVVAGETLQFEVDNVAGFDHNFWIGTPDQLQVPNGTTDTGHPHLDIRRPDRDLDGHRRRHCSSPARCPATTRTMHADIVISG